MGTVEGVQAKQQLPAVLCLLPAQASLWAQHLRALAGSARLPLVSHCAAETELRGSGLPGARSWTGTAG